MALCSMHESVSDNTDLCVIEEDIRMGENVVSQNLYLTLNPTTGLCFFLFVVHHFFG